MAGSESKAAEQARLSELFKLLTSRRPQSLSNFTSVNASTNNPHTRNDMDATDAEPLLRHNISTATSQHDTGGTRPRRNTVASVPTQTLQQTPAPAPAPSGMSRSSIAAETLKKFPLAAAKKYPFTFKLMIYKLYNKEDWAKTVKEMLEKSKDQFKTLAEKEKEMDVVYAGAKEEDEAMPPLNKDGSAVRFKLSVPSPGAGRRSSLVGGRQRSISISNGVPLYAPRPASAYPRSPFPKSPPPVPSSPMASRHEPSVRVLKKRCVGRRRSMSLSGASPAGTVDAGNAGQPPRISGTWVYNAAVSASERPAAATTHSLMQYLPDDTPPSPTGRFQAPREYAPLGSKNLKENNQFAGAPKTMMVPKMMPLTQVSNSKERLVARRRAMTVGSTDKDRPIVEQRKAPKRPFAG